MVAALIWRQGSLLICQRKATGSFPGKWEFPGGKVEPEEEPRAALQRELFEELGIRAEIGEELARLEHQYTEGPTVRLLFYAVTQFEGVPENRVFQQILWVQPHQLLHFDFLEADQPLIERIAAHEFFSPGS
ncbi:MAG: (deoxy)nucleoside triphosphate pyrophosphohydrolase [Acidobacteria bacterium]|nr:(deoxy)nucleoside triphosphate pyrophosphohydrolase [Acidobacteriota bacterium]